MSPPFLSKFRQSLLQFIRKMHHQDSTYVTSMISHHTDFLGDSAVAFVCFVISLLDDAATTSALANHALSSERPLHCTYVIRGVA